MIEDKIVSKTDLLNKLRAYRKTPDDDNIVYKQKIKKALLSNPYLLYALNEKDLESELFNDKGNINWEWDEKNKKYEPLGEWDRYFSDTAGDGKIFWKQFKYPSFFIYSRYSNGSKTLYMLSSWF